MKLELSRPLVCFDLESTGPMPKLDRIVEIGLVKLYPGGGSKSYSQLVNPGIPIPAEATAIHGIKDADVAAAPKFAELAKELAKGFVGCDIAGFNVRKFDVPLLKAEFERAKLDSSSIFTDETKYVDVYRIFQMQSPRTLTAAAQHYLNSEAEESHRALADVETTLAVLEQQLLIGLEKLPGSESLPQTVDEIHAACFEQIPAGFADPEGKFMLRGDRYIFTFSKNNGRDIRTVERGFLDWMLRQDFSRHVIKIVQEELDRRDQDVY
jgi:DNA polymerase-3 subunit epsilon